MVKPRDFDSAMAGHLIDEERPRFDNGRLYVLTRKEGPDR